MAKQTAAAKQQSSSSSSKAAAAGGNSVTHPNGAAKTELEEPAPFDLPLSREARRAKQNIFAALAVAAVVVAALAAAPARVWDPVGCAVFFYVLALFCFQNTFIEWPVLGIWEALLLGGAIEAMVAPTLLNYFGLWHLLAWRPIAWSFQGIVVYAAHCHMVRGPTWDLPAGCLQGRTCIITGCNAGIGYETAAIFAHAGAHVIFACRTESKARAAMQRLLKEADGAVKESQLQFFQLDVSSLASVKKFVGQLEREKVAIQTLVLNAGVMMGSRKLSEDGFELTMASNHFGHFLLVQLLLPGLLAAEKRDEKPRIVVVGSMLGFRHDRFDWGEIVKVTGQEAKNFLERPFSLFRAYEQSKLCNLLFTTELARRLLSKGSKMPVNCVHPGEALTEVAKEMHPLLLWLQRSVGWLAYSFLKTVRQGSTATVHAATAPNQGSGQFCVRLKPTPLTRLAGDEHLAAQFWSRSVELTGAPTDVL